MNDIPLNRTFIIKSATTGEMFTLPNGKYKWSQRGNAKTAFTLSTSISNGERFDDQNEYILEELKSEEWYKLQEVQGLIEELSGSFIDSGKGSVVLELLKGVVDSK